jgi:cysteinyl-tRNA synthetase
MDFVLWKPSKAGEPAWPSPAGIKTAGRPGWHIECSAMSWKHLGETFDIHGGGIDLLFPHHENEIAQSRSAFHTPLMARTWMHNGFLQVEGEKMAKSAGNFVTIRELLADWPGEVLRLNMLRTHYRQPIDWTEAGIGEAERTLDQWYALTSTVPAGRPSAGMIEALSDDLNTPRALSVLHELRQEAAKGDKEAAADLKGSAQMLGLLQMNPADWTARRRLAVAVDDAQIETLIEARNAARKAKNFSEADRIRKELDAMGVELEDKKDGTTTWKVKR